MRIVSVVIYQFGSNKRTGRFCHSNPLGCALSVNTVKHVLLFVSKQLCHKERYLKKKKLIDGGNV